MSFHDMVVLYVALLLGMLLLFSWLTEKRRKRFGFTPSEDTLYRCTQCGFVYTDDADVDRSRCPHCGKANDAITF